MFTSIICYGDLMKLSEVCKVTFFDAANHEYCDGGPDGIWLPWVLSELVVALFYILSCVIFIFLTWINHICVLKKDNDFMRIKDIRKQSTDYLEYHRNNIRYYGLNFLIFTYPIYNFCKINSRHNYSDDLEKEEYANFSYDETVILKWIMLGCALINGILLCNRT
jgi:hypothetical protein